MYSVNKITLWLCNLVYHWQLSVVLDHPRHAQHCGGLWTFCTVLCYNCHSLHCHRTHDKIDYESRTRFVPLVEISYLTASGRGDDSVHVSSAITPTLRSVNSWGQACSDNILYPFGAIFKIFAHPVFKMWIIQEPNEVELWNKWHFEEKRT
jgi:hypothetical protein